MAFYRQHPECIVARREELTLSLRGQEQLALAIASAALIAKQFCIGEKPPTLNDLARRFQVPEKIVGQLLDVLQRSGYIVAMRDDPPGYMPARPPETIAVAELFS